MKEEDKTDMESRIIEAAKVVFVRKGYEATKMGDIAAEVGISRTAMHYYFRTKEILFEAIFEQLMGSLLPNIKAIMDEEGTILEKLPKVIDQYLAALHNNPLFPVFVINEMNRDPEHLYKAILKKPEKIEPIIRLRAQIQQEMEMGLLKKRPLIETASTLLSLVVFPLLVQHPFSTVFFDGDTNAFNTFLDSRKELIYDVMHHIMAPNGKE